MRRAKSFGLWAFATALCLGVSSVFVLTTVAVRSGFGPAVIVVVAATVLFSAR